MQHMSTQSDISFLKSEPHKQERTEDIFKSLPAWSHKQTRALKTRHKGHRRVRGGLGGLLVLLNDISKNTFARETCPEKKRKKVQALNSPSGWDRSQTPATLEFYNHCLHTRATQNKHILEEGRSVIETVTAKKKGAKMQKQNTMKGNTV